MSEASGADRNAQIGLYQGGRVVDAVTHHRDHPALVLQPPNLSYLVLRQHLGQHLLDADLLGDRGSRAGVVAGDHGYL